jgi:cytochrome bd ubiquinol oxidase subunit II
MPLLAYVAFAIIAVGVLLYVLLDGWDLGVGILFPLAAREQERDEMMESIAPFWDGNETWLVFGGVTLFAAFSSVYALMLHLLYMPVMVMLFALVFRGISFEFRSHAKDSKPLWNWTFALGSIVVAFSQGMILGKLQTWIGIACVHSENRGLMEWLFDPPRRIPRTGPIKSVMAASFFDRVGVRKSQ